jgi:hypothetical protein
VQYREPVALVVEFEKGMGTVLPCVLTDDLGSAALDEAMDRVPEEGHHARAWHISCPHLLGGLDVRRHGIIELQQWTRLGMAFHGGMIGPALAVGTGISPRVGTSPPPVRIGTSS